MISLPILQYDFDEEARGFGEPVPEPPSIHVGAKIGIALVALGVLAFVLTTLWLGTASSADADRTSSWPMILGSFGLIGAGAVLAFWFRYAGTIPGIKHNSTMFRNVQARGWVAWGLGIFITGFYVVLYWYGDLQRNWEMAPILEGPIRLLDPLAIALTKEPADQWFLYGFLYTLCVLVFGFRMILKYRHNRYQIVRTCSVAFFQLGFAFILPGILKRLNEPDYYFTYFWPLKPEYAWPGNAGSLDWISQSDLGWLMIGFGIFAILVLTPTLTYFFGKRWYCSWVCGCGGLAETLGDPWRQLSSKSTFAWKIERALIYSVLIFVVAVTALLWIDNARSGGVLGSFSLTARKWYGFLIVNAFAGVVGVGFYPLMGSRVWCRFGCPMAAILGFLQRYYSRFRITTNGSQCMSCGNCSTYCEMGIDVRAYAQRGENIVRASCVGCGVCAAVCPRGVLKLENGATSKGRYDGVGGPLDQFLVDLSTPPSANRPSIPR